MLCYSWNQNFFFKKENTILLDLKTECDSFLFEKSFIQSLNVLGLSWQLRQASLISQLVKNLPAMQETWVRSLGWDDPLKKGKVTHSSFLTQRIPWTIHVLDSIEPACNTGDPGSIPGSGGSSGEGNSKPLQYICLEKSVDGGSWQATVHGVTKSQTRPNEFHYNYYKYTDICM